MFLFAGGGARGPAESAQQKFEFIEQNGRRPHPDPRPTELTEQEINAYFASGKLRLPDGVQSLEVHGVAGVVSGSCRVDFDRVRAGKGGSNPLLQLFSGVHQVEAEARASGANHQGKVHINSVIVDGVEVPQFLLELFVDKYVTPKYPGVGLDSTFPLPDKIESATVGAHVLTIVQR